MKLPPRLVLAGLPPEFPLADMYLLEDWFKERDWLLWVFHTDTVLDRTEYNPTPPWCGKEGHWVVQVYYHPMPLQFFKNAAEWSLVVGSTRKTYGECYDYIGPAEHLSITRRRAENGQ